MNGSIVNAMWRLSPLALLSLPGNGAVDSGARDGEKFRHIAINLLRREPHHKRGIKARRKRAGWDRDYLVQVLTGESKCACPGRRAKSDGLDVRKLLSMLMRYHHGERQVWQVVKIP